jgi:hypothetical protein
MKRSIIPRAPQEPVDYRKPEEVSKKKKKKLDAMLNKF